MNAVFEKNSGKNRGATRRWLSVRPETLFGFSRQGGESAGRHDPEGDAGRIVEGAQRTRRPSDWLEKLKKVSGRTLTLAAGAGLLLLGISLPAAADDFDPFETGNTSWISLDHFSDKATRFPSALETPGDKEPPQAAPIPEIETPATEKITTPPVKEQPVKTETTRALNLPIMPGINEGFGLSVNSTQEDEKEEGAGEEAVARPTRPLNLPVMPGVGQSKTTENPSTGAEGEKPASEINDQKWKDAKTTAKKAAKGEMEERQIPINVRLATLPDNKTKPIAGGPIIKPHKKNQQEETAPRPLKQKQQEAEKMNTEACAAITAYRKKQLAAIESDRQTLNALQAAITEMGLDKKLDFLKGASNNLTAIPKPGDVSQGKPPVPKAPEALPNEAGKPKNEH
jgi:hypothetical protein